MTTLTLYREDKLDTIIGKILDLVNKYRNTKNNLREIESNEVIKSEHIKKRKYKGEQKYRTPKKLKLNKL